MYLKLENSLMQLAIDLKKLDIEAIIRKTVLGELRFEHEKWVAGQKKSSMDKI